MPDIPFDQSEDAIYDYRGWRVVIKEHRGGFFVKYVASAFLGDKFLTIDKPTSLERAESEIEREIDKEIGAM